MIVAILWTCAGLVGLAYAAWGCIRAQRIELAHD